MEQFLDSLRAGEFQGESGFTVAAERARRLLSERRLTDPWQAWSCLVQGLLRVRPQALSISVEHKRVAIRCDFEQPVKQTRLFADDRFLLGWLNLELFGVPSWNQGDSTVSVTLSGSVGRRYQVVTLLRKMFRKTLAYAPIPVTLNGESVNLSSLPAATRYTLFTITQGYADSLLPLSLASPLPSYTVRFVSLETEAAELRTLAALAFKTRHSWSQAVWVNNGVTIREERNCLERPGLCLIGSVQALNLETDLSGFKIIHNDNYIRFVNQVKKDVLWML